MAFLSVTVTQIVVAAPVATPTTVTAALTATVKVLVIILSTEISSSSQNMLIVMIPTILISVLIAATWLSFQSTIRPIINLDPMSPSNYLRINTFLLEFIRRLLGGIKSTLENLQVTTTGNNTSSSNMKIWIQKKWMHRILISILSRSERFQIINPLCITARLQLTRLKLQRNQDSTYNLKLKNRLRSRCLKITNVSPSQFQQVRGCTFQPHVSSASQWHERSEINLLIDLIMQSNNHYDVLGIKAPSLSLANNTLLQKVTKSFRKIASKLHPDQCNLPGAEEAFKKANNAYSSIKTDLLFSVTEPKPEPELDPVVDPLSSVVLRHPTPLEPTQQIGDDVLCYMYSFYASIQQTLPSYVDGNENLVIGPVIELDKNGGPPSIYTYCPNSLHEETVKITFDALNNWNRFEFRAGVSPFDPNTALANDIKQVKGRRDFSLDYFQKYLNKNTASSAAEAEGASDAGSNAEASSFSAAVDVVPKGDEWPTLEDEVSVPDEIQPDKRTEKSCCFS